MKRDWVVEVQVYRTSRSVRRGHPRDTSQSWEKIDGIYTEEEARRIATRKPQARARQLSPGEMRLRIGPRP